jgi:hypothetical protein
MLPIGLRNVSEDTTPTLGGDVDGNSKEIDSLAALGINTTVDVATNVLKITAPAGMSASESVGGAFNLVNTANVGAGMVLYTALGATADGHLFSARVNNAAFDYSAVRVSSNGASHTATFLNDGTGANSSCFNAASTNPNASAFQASGVETGKGTLKVAHTGTGTDGNASGISIALVGSGTAAQGIFLDATTAGGTSGKLLNLRNDGNELLTLSATGVLALTQESTTGASPVLTLEQKDVSEEFIELHGTSAGDNSQSLVDAADLAVPGAVVGWFKVKVTDDAGAGDITDGTYYVPFHATPTTP